jgi:Chaperone of endosialidase
MVSRITQTGRLLSTMFFVAALLFALPASAARGVPAAVSYQGTLADTGGNPLGGTGTQYYFRFSLWDSATVGQGSRVWPASAPTALPLLVRQGAFSVDIGGAGYPDALDYDFSANSSVYLQVEVSPDDSSFETLSPRSAVTSSPFAQVASRVSGLGQSTFGTTSPFASSVLTAQSTSSSAVALTLFGAAGQASHIFDVFSSTGSSLFAVAGDGKVGIGTTTPGARLSVKGAGLTTGQAFQVTDSADSPKVTVLDSGNVGIGTSTPSNKLEVVGNAAKFYNGSNDNDGLTIFPNDSNKALVTGFRKVVFGAINHSGAYSAPSVVFNGSTANLQMRSSTVLQWSNNSSNAEATTDAGLTRGSAGVLRVSNGSTGGGSLMADYFTATSTTATSTFAGSIDASNGVLKLGSAGGNTSIVLPTLSNGVNPIISTSYSTNVFSIGGGANEKIDFNAGQHTLTVSGNLVASSLTGGSAINSSLSLKSTSGVGTSDYIRFLVGNNGATEAMRVTTSGNVGIGTTTPTAQLSTTGTVRFAALTGAGSNLVVDALGNVTVSSDERLKDISGQFTRGLADVRRLSPITYHWKPETGYDTANAYTGFSAQNVQSAIPEAVATSASGYLNLADRPILAAVVNAVKELDLKVSSLTDGTAELVVRKIKASELCLDDICINKDQLRDLLNRNGVSASVSAPVLTESSSTPASESGVSTSASTTTVETVAEPIATSTPEIIPEQTPVIDPAL